MLPGINIFLSILAVVLCFVPIGLYWWKKLAPDKTYLSLSIFWLINGITYAPEIFNWNWYNNASDQITLFYNLIDTPQILLMFYFLTEKKIFKTMLLAFLVFEVVAIAWKGFNFDSNNIIIGFGTLICLLLNIWAISKYFLRINHTDKENVMVYVYAGFIFYYGLFPFIYFFNYLQNSGSQRPYVVFINYSAICLATGLISFGLWKYAYTNYKDEHF